MVEHRGWEVLGELAERSRSNYDKGWAVVLEPFRAAVERRSE